MAQDIREADWKVFRRLQPLALERFCERALGEIGRLASDTSMSNHERYLAVYRLLQERDRDLAAAFNGPRRSTAFIQLVRIWADDLLTKEESAQFSDDMCRSAESLRNILG